MSFVVRSSLIAHRSSLEKRNPPPSVRERALRESIPRQGLSLLWVHGVFPPPKRIFCFHRFDGACPAKVFLVFTGFRGLPRQGFFSFHWFSGPSPPRFFLVFRSMYFRRATNAATGHLIPGALSRLPGCVRPTGEHRSAFRICRAKAPEVTPVVMKRFRCFQFSNDFAGP